MKLIVHVNPEGRQMNIDPLDHVSDTHTHLMKTVAVKQALDEHGFDVALAVHGVTKRSRERTSGSFRSERPNMRGIPKNQRPELWRNLNARPPERWIAACLPLSNWTELDAWLYIQLRQIPVVPLYFAAERPIVERQGTLIMVDDARMPLGDGEHPAFRKVRFLTLGCYPSSAPSRVTPIACRR